MLHRIRALKDFGDVKKGDLGGFIEKEENLSQEDSCWVYKDAVVYENARVRNDAKVFGYAKVFGKALIHGYAKIYGESSVFGEANVHGHAKIYDNTFVFENSDVSGFVDVFEDAEIYGDAKICGGTALIHGNAEIYGEAAVTHNADVSGHAQIFGYIRLCKAAMIVSSDDAFCIGPIGSRHEYTTFYKGKDNTIIVACGCFNNTINVFEEQVKETHKDNEKYLKQYLSVIDFAKAYLSI